ncbi:hypothetical protein Rs2_02835 [Raphanus sativus]|nr:hypothetical protein Rs2_02835 [Raphanus sativus]
MHARRPERKSGHPRNRTSVWTPGAQNISLGARRPNVSLGARRAETGRLFCTPGAQNVSLGVQRPGCESGRPTSRNGTSVLRARRLELCRGRACFISVFPFSDCFAESP